MNTRIRNRGIVPYGGMWRTRDRMTGIPVEGTNFNMVVNRIRDARKANGIPEGIGFEDEVEKWLCEDHPTECELYDPNAPRQRSLTITDVIHGTKVLLAFKMAGSPLVSAEEANRRAAICNGCQFNIQFPKPCSGICPDLKRVVEGIIGNQRTSLAQDNRSCSICGCFTESQVWLPLDILDRGLTDEMRNQFNSIPHCWKKTQTTP